MGTEENRVLMVQQREFYTGMIDHLEDELKLLKSHKSAFERSRVNDGLFLTFERQNELGVEKLLGKMQSRLNRIKTQLNELDLALKYFIATDYADFMPSFTVHDDLHELKSSCFRVKFGTIKQPIEQGDYQLTANYDTGHMSTYGTYKYRIHPRLPVEVIQTNGRHALVLRDDELKFQSF
jgi:hypothetical protein